MMQNLRPHFAAQAKERQLATLKQNADKETVPQKIAERKNADSRDQAGKAAGVNGRYVDMAGQWACIAADADDLLAVIAEQVEKERIEKQKANAVNQHSEPLGKKLPQPSTPKDDQKTATKAAELFNTNRTVDLTAP